MIKAYTIENGQGPTAEQLAEVAAAENYPITFDEDCPELSPAMMKAFRSVVVQRNRKKNNPFVPLTEDQILSDLAESRQQAKNGQYRPAEDVLNELERDLLNNSQACE